MLKMLNFVAEKKFNKQYRYMSKKYSQKVTFWRGMLLRCLLLGILTLSLSGCVAKRNLVLFQDADDYIDSKRIATTYDIRIQPDDQLAISVSSQDKELIDVFNNTIYIGQNSSGGGMYMQQNYGSGGTLGNNTLFGFHVDKDGCIEFPVFGRLSVEGMTRNEIASLLQNKLRQGFINDAVVRVELLSFRVVVIGAVGKESIITVGKDRCTIVEALTMAGGVTHQGFRKNVLVIREENGEIWTYRVDFTDLSSLLNSPVYYLKQNDIIYIEPNGTIQVEASPVYRYMTAFTAISSFIMTLATLLYITK